MKTQEKTSRFRLRKPIIFLIITAFIGLTLYTINFRNDWMFGLMDTLFHEREGVLLEVLEYHSQDIESIPLDELSSLSTNVKTTNSLSLINRKHRIDDDLDFNLVNFRDTSLLVDENIIDDLENLLHDVKQNTDERYTLQAPIDQQRIRKGYIKKIQELQFLSIPVSIKPVWLWTCM